MIHRRRVWLAGQVDMAVVLRRHVWNVRAAGLMTIATRLRLVYLVTLVDTRHRDGRTARYVQLARPMWTVTHRLSVRCVRRVTMLVQDRRFALHVLRVSTMTMVTRALHVVVALWARTLLRRRWCAPHVLRAIMTTTMIRQHRVMIRMRHARQAITCRKVRTNVRRVWLALRT